METTQNIFRPRELYETMLKNQYHAAAEQFYDALARQANTDQAANAMHVKDYKAADEEVKAAEKKLGKAKSGKGWTIFGIVISFLAAIIVGVVGGMNATTMWWLILVAVALLGLGVFFIVLLNTKVKNAVAVAKEELEKKQAIAKTKLDLCYKDMEGLNDLLDDSMPCQVMEKATPLIDLDRTFTPERVSYMKDTFGFKEETDPDTSVLGVLSGQIQGNPFVLEKVFRHEVRDKVYEGTLVITWTTTSTDADGHTRTETHTETLHAEAVHPAPSYWDETRLIFASEVAPNLHFSRQPSGMSDKSDKDKEKFVRRRVKELDKREEKAIKEGKNFTKLGNDEFEAYFGADNRDHEVEYRLMYNALAQVATLDLLKNPKPYGDDFVMVKDGMLTSVCSRHSQNFDYYATANSFANYDFTAGRKYFIDYCDAFVRGLFFDLAPILAVPLYQTHKPRDYIYNGGYPTNLSSFEHESLINKMDRGLFMPKDADESLPLLLKESNAVKAGRSDEVCVSSRSYKTTPMVDYVSVHGGDGRFHQVPVHWIQYDEVSCKRNVGIAGGKKSRSIWNHSSLEPLKKYLKDNFHFERGLVSFYLGEKDHLNSKDGDEIDSYLNKD